MKLLIITQKIDKNDGVLSFMIGWIKQFAQQCEEVIVIALYVGEYELPENVKVFSLGKEHGVSRLKYLVRFFRYIFSQRSNYDAVFVHMNQIYAILGGVLWKLMGKFVALWYAHGYVPWNLRMAEILSDAVIASTPSGFRLNTGKLHIVGQGINTEQFVPLKRECREGEPLRLLIVGRISPAKDYHTLLEAIRLMLDEHGQLLTLDVVGGPGTIEQEKYFDDVKQHAMHLGLSEVVRFHGAIPHEETVKYFQRAHVFVSTATNGSFDKAMGDAMATGLPLVTCSEAMEEVLGDLKSLLMFQKRDIDGLIKTLLPILEMTQEERDLLGMKLRAIIERDHSLRAFVGKILRVIQGDQTWRKQ